MSLRRLSASVPHRLSAPAEPGPAALQRRPEPGLVDPVEVMLLAVDEDDRDQLGVLLAQAVVVQDRQLLPARAGVRRDAFDHDPGVVAQMAAGLADQGDPSHEGKPRTGPARRGYSGRMPADDEIPPSSHAPGIARLTGEAAAQATSTTLAPPPDPTAGAFFDVDNTVMRGASIFHLARGLYERDFFSLRDIAGFAWQQLSFLARGENLEHIDQIQAKALGFIAGHSVSE